MAKDFSRVYSAQTHLLDAHIITIETDLSKGLHSFTVVGLPDKAVEEARDRVSAAIKNSGFKPPKAHNKKIVVSLAPANVRKAGPHFDLALALGYLLAADEISFDPEKKLFLGELALDGTLRPIAGTLALVLAAKKAGFSEVFVPNTNADEATLVSGITVYPARTLTEVIAHVTTQTPLSPHTHPHSATHVAETPNVFEDIKEQQTAKRGLIIAAAGGHNIALYGPPGTGKTMLAKAFASILPTLTPDESLEVTRIHSIAGMLKEPLLTQPPIRSPHHTASYASLVGGGTHPSPGEVTLAHKGVLFMDEFPEFGTHVINALRQPLEDGIVRIARAKGTAEFPSQFILVAALNPCPCGYAGTSKCMCTQSQLQRYRSKISGPIIDRIDMWIEVGQVAHEKLNTPSTSGETIAARSEVAHARTMQTPRGALNARLTNKHIAQHAKLTPEAENILNLSAKKQDLSPRAYHRVIKLARTIADLTTSEHIEPKHVLEALSYRPKAEF